MIYTYRNNNLKLDAPYAIFQWPYTDTWNWSVIPNSIYHVPRMVLLFSNSVPWVFLFCPLWALGSLKVGLLAPGNLQGPLGSKQFRSIICVMLGWFLGPLGGRFRTWELPRTTWELPGSPWEKFLHRPGSNFRPILGPSGANLEPTWAKLELTGSQPGANLANLSHLNAHLATILHAF